MRLVYPEGLPDSERWERGPLSAAQSNPGLDLQEVPAKMIRILHVVAIMNAGGMENYIMNLYRKMDRTRIQFDFLVHYQKPGFFDREIEEMGGRIYRMTVREDNNPIKYCRDLDSFFRTHTEYRIVHGHLSSLAVFYLRYAKKYGVPWRISHSHGAGFLKTPKGYAKYILFRFAKIYANQYYACSGEAGRYLFGKTPFEFMPNSIETSRFHYDGQHRLEIRRQLGIENAFVVGHVGRFNLQKNHRFILNAFICLKEWIPQAKLLLVGDGELRPQIEQMIREKRLSDSVVLTGVRKDTEKLYQAMDVFILPSLFEGLPVTGIEAQYEGLPCLFADTISQEVAINDQAEFLSIAKGMEKQWAGRIAELAFSARADRAKVRMNNDLFNADKAAAAMFKRYQSMWEKTP